MDRLSDLVKGGGEEPRPRRTGPGAPSKLGDLIRKGGKPVPPAREGAPPESTPPEGGPAPGSPEAAGTPAVSATGTPPAATPPPKETVPADQVLRQAMTLTQQVHDAVRANALLPVAKAEEAVELLLGSLMASDSLLVPFFSGGGPASSGSREAVNVCILSLRIGQELSYAHGPLRKLGLAALLCDVGMTRVPAQILGKPGPLSPEERGVVGTHQLEGAKLLQALGPQYRWLAEVVERRYAKMEGAPPAENELDEYAAAIRLADAYESMSHNRPFRSRLGSLEGLKELLRQERATAPDRVLKALVRAMSAFPVGSLVRLNTGEIGRVVARSKDLPLRPVVEVLVRRGRRLEEAVKIDLSQSPLHHIQDSAAEEALP